MELRPVGNALTKAFIGELPALGIALEASEESWELFINGVLDKLWRELGKRPHVDGISDHELVGLDLLLIEQGWHWQQQSRLEFLRDVFQVTSSN